MPSSSQRNQHPRRETKTARMLSLVLFFALPGCALEKPLSTEPPEAAAQIQRWVGVGTLAPDAKRVMERHGFTCTLVKSGAFDSLRGVDYVYCDRRESAFAQRRWQAALLLVEGKVSAVHVTTGVVAP